MELFKELQYRTVTEEERANELDLANGYREVLVVDFQRDQRFVYACKYSQLKKSLFVLTKTEFVSLKDIEPNEPENKVVVNHKEALHYLVSARLVEQSSCHYFDEQEVVEKPDKIARLHNVSVVIEKELEDDLNFSEKTAENYVFGRYMYSSLRVIEMALHESDKKYSSPLATYPLR